MKLPGTWFVLATSWVCVRYVPGSYHQCTRQFRYWYLVHISMYLTAIYNTTRYIPVCIMYFIVFLYAVFLQGSPQLVLCICNEQLNTKLLVHKTLCFCLLLMAGRSPSPGSCRNSPPSCPFTTWAFTFTPAPRCATRYAFFAF